MNLFISSLLLYYIIHVCITIILKKFYIQWFYFGLIILIVVNLIVYILLNPTLLLIPYNLIIENTYKKKVFYSENEKLEIFPTSKILEKNWKEIRNEYLNLVSKEEKENKSSDDNIGKRFVTETDEFWKGWNTYELRSFDKDNERFLNECPILKRILKNDPNISTAFFSVVEPWKVIPSHYGPFKGILRYHMGLICPQKDCFISVDGETYDWKDGEGVLFDESYKHFVRNDTPYYRVILFIDVRRPVRFPIINNFLMYLMSISPYNL